MEAANRTRDGTEQHGPGGMRRARLPGGAAAVTAIAELRRAGQVRLIDSLVVESATGEVSTSELVECEEYDEATPRSVPRPICSAPRTRPRPPRRSNRARARRCCSSNTSGPRAADAIREAGGRIAGTVRVPPEVVEEAQIACREAVTAAAIGSSRACSCNAPLMRPVVRSAGTSRRARPAGPAHARGVRGRRGEAARRQRGLRRLNGVGLRRGAGPPARGPRGRSSAVRCGRPPGPAGPGRSRR